MATSLDKLTASLKSVRTELDRRARSGWLQRWFSSQPETPLLATVDAALESLGQVAAEQAAERARLAEIQDILGKFNDTLLRHEQRLAESDGLKPKLGVLSAQLSALVAHADAVQAGLADLNRRQQAHAASLDEAMGHIKKLLRDRGPDRPEEFARFYLAFENQFRGTREQIAAKHAPYLPHVAAALQRSASKRWFDMGCGRGEWLELLLAQGAEAIGVDDNPAMLKACRERGLAVRDADALAHLESQPAGSCAGISAFHLIEHLPYRTMLAFFHAAHAALAPGGCLIVETPNPQNVSVGACNFYMDVTHQKPIPPMTAEFIARHTGFSEVSVLRLHPQARHAERDSLPTVTDREYCEMFYGPQDYAIVAVK